MNKAILADAQWYLNTMLSASGSHAYQMVFGSNAVDSFGRGAGEGT